MTALRLRAGVLLAALTLLLSGCAVGPLPFGGGTMKVTAWFADSAGVFVGNDVGVLGVPVGTITAITPAGDRVAVTMQVHTDHPIPAGAAAVVVPRSVATDRYVELTPAYTDGPRMRDGAVIPLDRTRTPVEFDEVLHTLGGVAEDLSGSGATRNAVRRLLSAQAQALSGRGPLIHRTITSLAAAANGLSAQRGKATSALVSLDRLTSTLASNEGTVRRFVRQVAAAAALLAAERDDFRTSLRKVTRMIRVVARFARENRSAVATTVQRTDQTMRTVLDQRTAVAEILREMPLAAQNLLRMLDDHDRLNVRLDITSLLPVLGPLFAKLCRNAPGDLCTALGLDPSQLADVLTRLLGGARP